MRIMLTGSEAGAVDTVARELTAAGHHVVNYLELDDAARAVPAQADVVLCARAHPLATLTRHEVFVAAAIDAGIPLVIAGAGAAHPLLDRAEESVPELDAATIESALQRAFSRRLLSLLVADAPDRVIDRREPVTQAGSPRRVDRAPAGELVRWT